MLCRSTPSVKPMPIRGQAELAEQGQDTASGRHVTGVPVISATWRQATYISFSLELFIVLNFWGNEGSRQALRPSLLDPVPLQRKGYAPASSLAHLRLCLFCPWCCQESSQAKGSFHKSVPREGLCLRGVYTVLQLRHPRVLGRPHFGQGEGSFLGSCWLSAGFLSWATPRWAGQWLVSR